MIPTFLGKKHMSLDLSICYYYRTYRGLETWARLSRSPGLREPDGADWPLRMRNHCRFLAEKMDGAAAAYDLWLRSAAGPHRQEDFEDFLCYGDGVFADCNEWIPNDTEWPAGG